MIRAVPHPILLNPPETIQTDRLVMRSTRAGDGPALFDSIVRSLPSLRRYPATMEWVLSTPTLDACEAFCREQHAEWILRRGLMLMLFEKATQQHVGCIGLRDFQWAVPRAEIGYWVSTPHGGKGYITEGLRAMTPFCFEQLQLRRVEAFPDEENVASCRVCERAGYTREGVLRGREIDPRNRSLRSMTVYAVTR